MKGLFLQLPGEFSDASIQKLWRDRVINDGTVYCYDALDYFSYAKQAAPSAGVDVWKDLKEEAAGAAFTGTVGFDNGFTFTNGSGGGITLPAAGVFPADADGFCTAIWFVTPPPVTGLIKLFGANTAYTDANCQYAIVVPVGATGVYKAYFGGFAPSNSVFTDPEGGTLLQIGLAAKKKPNGKYNIMVFRNGAKVAQSESTFDSLPQPADVPKISGGTTHAADKVLRVWADDCSIHTADELIELDYAANHARLAVAVGGS